MVLFKPFRLCRQRAGGRYRLLRCDWVRDETIQGVKLEQRNVAVENRTISTTEALYLLEFLSNEVASSASPSLRTPVLAQGVSIVDYVLYMFLHESQKPLKSPTKPSKKQAKKDDVPVDLSVNGGIMQYFLRTGTLSFFRSMSEIIRCIAVEDPNERQTMPKVYLDYETTQRASPPSDGVLVLFRSDRDFYNLFGITTSQLSKGMVFHKGK